MIHTVWMKWYFTALISIVIILLKVIHCNIILLKVIKLWNIHVKTTIKMSSVRTTSIFTLSYVQTMDVHACCVLLQCDHSLGMSLFRLQGDVFCACAGAILKCWKTSCSKNGCWWCKTLGDWWWIHLIMDRGKVDPQSDCVYAVVAIELCLPLTWTGACWFCCSRRHPVDPFGCSSSIRRKTWSVYWSIRLYRLYTK